MMSLRRTHPLCLFCLNNLRLTPLISASVMWCFSPFGVCRYTATDCFPCIACRLRPTMQGAEALVAEYHSSFEQCDKDDMGHMRIIDELTTRLQDDPSEFHPFPFRPTLPCLPVPRNVPRQPQCPKRNYACCPGTCSHGLWCWESCPPDALEQLAQQHFPCLPRARWLDWQNVIPGCNQRTRLQSIAHAHGLVCMVQGRLAAVAALVQS
jgi:hypothetical protein